jgi:hypothetical protein
MAEYGNVKEFRCYKPKNDGNGAATAWQLSFKKDNKFNPWMFFLVAAKQEGTDDKGNAKFNWKEGALTVKLGDNDLGEIISVLEGRKDSLGTKGSLFHQTPSGGNKVIKMEANEYGFNIAVSAQDENKNRLGPIYHSLTHGEASLLLILLKKAVETIYGW